ncbi:hypothetical protein D3C76_1447210 [compost metagenome]
MSEVAQATLGVKNLTPDPCQRQQVVSRGQWRGLLFDEHPGNCSGIAQVDGEFQVRPAEEGVLAGQATHKAGQVGIAGQIIVPECLVTVFANAVKAVATSVMQG